MKTLFFIAAWLFCSTVSAGQILPNAADLKAAYCTQVARAGAEISGIEELPEPAKTSVREFQKQAQQNLRRLQLYLQPRMALLETTALLAAAQGAKDDQALAAAELESCMAQPGAELKTCLAADSEAAKRIRSCRDLSFLPF